MIHYTVIAKSIRYLAFDYSFTLVIDRYFVLPNNSFKSWSIFKNRDSFEICMSWGFQNCSWKFNLTKIWLWKSRDKTKSNIKHYFEIDLLSFTWIISVKSWSNLTFRDSFEILRTCRFQTWPCFWHLTKICRRNVAKQNIGYFC